MTASFVILSTARSGSNWLVDRVNLHEDLTALGEFFNPQLPRHVRNPEFDEFIYSNEFSAGRRPLSTFRYMRHMFPTNRLRGFKLHYGHIRHFPELGLLLAFRRDRIIHLVRRNQLDVLISMEIVYRHLRTWTIGRSEGPPKGDLQIRLDPVTLVGTLRRRYRLIETARRMLKIARLPHIEVVYEDLCEGDHAFRPIWEFLGKDPPCISERSKYIKIQRKRHRDVIGNYAEVQSVLRGTDFENLLQQA